MSKYKPHGKYDMPFDPEQCQEEVPHEGRRVGFHQCARLAKRDGYCKQHHPDVAAEREKKRQREWDAEERARDRRNRIEELPGKQVALAKRALERIAYGDEGLMRSTAVRVLERLKQMEKKARAPA